MPPAAVSSAADPRLIPRPELIERFRANLASLWPSGHADPAGRLAIAVSGGPDSTALLLLAAAALPDRVEAATVDHRLRAESAGEAADVAGLCARLDVPHAVLPVSVGSGNLQAEARRARYAALAEWMASRRLAVLATGHHADDQAETLLLRLNRASGVAGLAGTRARGVVPESEIPLLRPLLGWRRGELAEIVAAANLTVAQDPSNGDDRFDRARMRRVLAETDWLDAGAMAESASHMADADAALDWAARREWTECVRAGGLGITYRPQAPRAIALRVLMRIVEEMDGQAPRGSAVARLFDALVARQTASIGNIVARPSPEGWNFTQAPRRRSSAA